MATIATVALAALLLLSASAQAAALTDTDVEPASLQAGAASTVTVSFTTVGSIPADGRIVVTFPGSFAFDSGAASVASCTFAGVADGGFGIAVAGQVVTITRDGTGAATVGGSAESCTITNVRNPQVSGSTGVYSIETQTGLGANIDGPTDAAADTIVANDLSTTNVEPADLKAGATSTVTASFTTFNPIPADGKLTVTFPGSFAFDSGAASVATCTFAGAADGTFGIAVAGQVVTITRNNDGAATVGGSAESCTITNVRNPQVSGSTGTYTLRTTDSADAAIDEDTAVAADTITANALSATNVEPASLAVGATSTVTLTFTTFNPIPADGTIVVVFPAGFDVSAASGGTCGSMDGTFATSVAGQAVTITRTPGSQQVGGEVETCTIDGIVNPGASGSTGTYTLRTTDSASATIDEDTAVAADTIAAAGLSATNVQPASLFPGATSTHTIAFTTANAIPADGKIVVTYPAGFDVSGAAGGTCSSMDGAFATAVAGQVVTITRDGAGTVQAGGSVETCTINSIVNPAALGPAGTYSIQTADAADAVINQDLAVPGDSFARGSGSVSAPATPYSWGASATVSSDDASPGALATYTFSFETGDGLRTYVLLSLQFDFPDGFEVHENPTKCEIVAPAGAVVKETIWDSETQVTCNLGFLASYPVGTPFQVIVRDVTNPQAAMSDTIGMSVLDGSEVWATVDFPFNVIAAEGSDTGPETAGEGEHPDIVQTTTSPASTATEGATNGTGGDVDTPGLPTALLMAGLLGMVVLVRRL